MINTKSLYDLLAPEPFGAQSCLLLLAWVFYKLFLRGVSAERHESLQNHFKKLFKHYIIFAILFAIFMLLKQSQGNGWQEKYLPLAGLIAYFWGFLVFVKVARLILLQYLFLGSMQSGVPALIVNIFSLILSILLMIWTASQIFSINLGPLLVTSAAFSVVLGFALQDTLGNLFAGISLQVDRSFEIGDWVEVWSGPQKYVGVVKEITWRSTILIGWSEEFITIPNRIMANSQISNYTTYHHPIYRSIHLRFPYGTELKKIESCAAVSAKEISGIRQESSPVCLISDITESWILVKIAFTIDDFGNQHKVMHEFSQEIMKNLVKYDLKLAHNLLELVQTKD